MEEVEQLEHKARRRDIVVDDETIFDFYAARVPPDVVSAAHFDSWWKRERTANPDLLSFPRDLLVNAAAADVALADFPDEWRSGEASLPLTYTFEPGSDADGVRVDIPLTTLPGVDARDFSWPVPGLRQELVVALIRSLPKALRVNFVPAPNVAAAFLAATTAGEQPLLDALERYLRRTTGVVVRRDDWRLDAVPAHLRPLFTVVGDDGRIVSAGRDLAALQADLAGSAQQAVSAAASELERSGITTWDFDSVPREFAQTRAGALVRGYPALVDEGDSVALRVLATPAVQETAMRSGVRRLVMLTVPSPGPGIANRLDNAGRLALSLGPQASAAALLDDCYAAAVDALIDACGGTPWERADFGALVAAVRENGEPGTEQVVTSARAALVASTDIGRRLSGPAALDQLAALTDMQGQLARLVHPGFVAAAGLKALRHYPRYFAAMGYRLDRLAGDALRDARSMAAMAGVQAAYLHAKEDTSERIGLPPQLQRVRWMVEELRVSLFAQHLKTPYPISVQRVEAALRELG
jgi:ATP-dependent helicase HrpA